MRTYLILKEKAASWNEDPEIQALVARISASDDGSMDAFLGPYTPDRAKALGELELDRVALGERGLPYEELDQLTIDLLLGAR